MIAQMAIFWRQTHIGNLLKPSLDMWYIEGEWQPYDLEITREFQKLTRDFTFHSHRNVQSADELMWVGVDENKPTHIFVMFFEQDIVVRVVFGIQPPKEWQ